MYKNLYAEMARQDLNIKKMADQINMNYGTLKGKVNGKYPFSWQEIKRIRDTFFPGLSIEYLLEDTGEQGNME